jgi:hypothetical protein
MLVRVVMLVGTLMVMTMYVVLAVGVGHVEDARKSGAKDEEKRSSGK